MKYSHEILSGSQEATFNRRSLFPGDDNAAWQGYLHPTPLDFLQIWLGSPIGWFQQRECLPWPYWSHTWQQTRRACRPHAHGVGHWWRGLRSLNFLYSYLRNASSPSNTGTLKNSDSRNDPLNSSSAKPNSFSPWLSITDYWKHLFPKFFFSEQVSSKIYVNCRTFNILLVLIWLLESRPETDLDSKLGGKSMRGGGQEPNQISPENAAIFRLLLQIVNISVN